MDVCPVEELKTQKEESPEQPPPKESIPEGQAEIVHTPPLEPAVQAEPEGEDPAKAKSPSPVITPVVPSAVSCPSPPTVIQVIK